MFLKNSLQLMIVLSLMLSVCLALHQELRQSHRIFDSSWKGDSCDKSCQANKGTVCGTVWKDCCVKSCSGWIKKDCDNGEVISLSKLDCGNSTKPAVQPVVQPVNNQTKPIVQPINNQTKPIVQPVNNQTKPTVQPAIVPFVQPVNNQTQPIVQPAIVPYVQPVNNQTKPIIQPVNNSTGVFVPVNNQTQPIVQPFSLRNQTTTVSNSTSSLTVK